ncbi:hypothetical protein, partial [Streptomyces tauricus]|uniref:hypothetical protein n=1 Tax=Streptomyces tauricus TaxID=68274 RepID=UPI001BCA20A8
SPQANSRQTNPSYTARFTDPPSAIMPKLRPMKDQNKAGPAGVGLLLGRPALAGDGECRPDQLHLCLGYALLDA